MNILTLFYNDGQIFSTDAVDVSENRIDLMKDLVAIVKRYNDKWIAQDLPLRVVSVVMSEDGRIIATHESLQIPVV